MKNVLKIFTLSILLIGQVLANKSTCLNANIKLKSSFKTSGLYYAELYQNIYEGEFLNITIARDDARYPVLMGDYLTAYAKSCGTSLPNNKVEMTTKECAMYEVTTNGWGVETGRTCVRYVDVGTGLYAKPDLYNAKVLVENIQWNNSGRDVWRGILNQNTYLNDMNNLISFHKQVEKDMAKLIAMNGCRSFAMKIFEKNLILYANNKLTNNQDIEAQTSNLTVDNQKLLDLSNDLILKNSHTWAMNKYSYGSTNNLKVLSQDDQGRPSMIKVEYNFQGWGGYDSGWVKISFNQGVPECLYFFDNPLVCRSADRGVISRYVKGEYTKSRSKGISYLTPKIH